MSELPRRCIFTCMYVFLELNVVFCLLPVPTRQKSAVDDMRFMNRVGTAESGTFSVASSFRSRKSGASGAVSNRSSGGIRPVSNGTAASGGGRRDRAGSADYDGLSDHATDERPSSHQSSRMGGAGDKTEQYRRMQVITFRIHCYSQAVFKF